MNNLSYADRLRFYLSVFWFLASIAYAAGIYEPGNSISGAISFAVIPVLAIWLVAFTLREKRLLILLSAAWVIATVAAVTIDDSGADISNKGTWLAWIITLTILPLLTVWISRRELT